MSRYIEKPLIVEAWEWNESKKTFKEIGCEMSGCSGHRDKPDLMNWLRIRTHYGVKSVNKGDYIIKHWNGNYDVMDSETFHMTYETFKEQ